MDGGGMDTRVLCRCGPGSDDSDASIGRGAACGGGTAAFASSTSLRFLKAVWA